MYYIDKAIEDYKTIKTIDDLRLNKLTLKEFADLFDLLHTIKNIGKAETNSLNIVKWCARRYLHIDKVPGLDLYTIYEESR